MVYPVAHKCDTGFRKRHLKWKKYEEQKDKLDIMENIFKDAYFGKAYKTRDGRKAIFYNHHNDGFVREGAKYVTMIIEGQESIYRWRYNGTAHDYQEYLDIVSEWEEKLTEKELDELAEKSFEEEVKIANQCEALGICHDIDYQLGFKNGCKEILKILKN